MKILVTGSDGCVGKSLKSICGKNDENSWIFINRNYCNLLNREDTIDLFKKIKADSIIHLASYVPGFYNIDKVASLNVNMRINENVLEASNASGIQSGAFCLSVNMFGDSPSKFPMDENMTQEGSISGPFQGYAYSKRILEIQCQNYNEQYNRNYYGVIPCNIYGDHDNFKSGRLIPNLILNFKKSIINNSDVIINGTGKPMRQFIYSYDLSRILKYLILNYFDKKSIICSSDEEISISELAKKIGEIMNFKNNIIFDSSKPDGNLKKTVSNEYLKSIIKNISFTSLNDGLKSTINNLGEI